MSDGSGKEERRRADAMMDNMATCQEEVLTTIEKLKGRKYSEVVSRAASLSGLLKMCDSLLRETQAKGPYDPIRAMMTEILTAVLMTKFDEALRFRPETEMKEFSDDVHSVQRHVYAFVTTRADEEDE